MKYGHTVMGVSGHLLSLLLLAAIPVSASAQATKPESGNDQRGYVFHANARDVLTDVTVTDKDGNPIRGLPRSAFHVLDNDRPQQLDSFEEHTSKQSIFHTESNPPNLVSNSFLLHPPAAFNVILLDTTTIDVIDQMYLYQQLTKFVQALPADQSIAIYHRAGELTVLMQNFTTDHNLLLAAVRKAIPHVPQPDAQYATDFGTLEQMVFHLHELPGRKNVFWFSGGSRFVLDPDPTHLPPSIDLRLVYDELETERIAIYPIDARGLTVELREGTAEQHMLMNEMADATGGQASYNDNGLAQIATHLVQTADDFYTLSYRPDNLKLNNKWHKVKISVDGSDYRLSYRRGYFDDGNRTLRQRQSRTTLLVGGKTIEAPDKHNEPIIFQARVLPSNVASPAPVRGASPAPAAPKRNEIAYSVDYSLPLDAFSKQSVNGETEINMGAAILAFSHSGRLTGHVAQKVTFHLNEQKLKTAGPSLQFPFHQQINLPKGEDFLYIAVWDFGNGRLGTVELPLDVQKTKDAQKRD